jgi:hypothetical protein
MVRPSRQRTVSRRHVYEERAVRRLHKSYQPHRAAIQVRASTLAQSLEALLRPWPVQGNDEFNRLVWDKNLAIFHAIDQAQLFYARDIGMHIELDALRSFRHGIGAGWADTAQCVEPMRA